VVGRRIKSVLITREPPDEPAVDPAEAADDGDAAKAEKS